MDDFHLNTNYSNKSYCDDRSQTSPGRLDGSDLNLFTSLTVSEGLRHLKEPLQETSGSLSRFTCCGRARP